MPIYFNDIAPTCPISSDEPAGPLSPTFTLPKAVPPVAPTIRTTIPPAFDLPSAIAAVNIARNIVLQLAFNYVYNNTYTAPPPPQPRTVDERHKSRWSEVASQRVVHNYKYYGVDGNGNTDQDTWIMTARIEQMVWYDSAWRTYLVWNYGNKGEGIAQ